ncbi:hypothetical protein [uncultured Kordia sp.]|uniref:hypothetical protein n=1 Tax=uncultured Kordia sp. TaxID=507699 RepID=UPI0026269C98|nr:hypothetical protein [uncultured Kordia sp.]
MKKLLLCTFVTLLSCQMYSQKMLLSWSQATIENYTIEMYDAAQKLTQKELLEKCLQDASWSEVFLTMNASVNNYKDNVEYKKALAAQITNTKETKLKGTSRLIIWDRIINGDITFEGKGLVFKNDLFLVSGRVNQLLEILTSKRFGIVTSRSTSDELQALQKNWQDYLSGETVEEFTPKTYKNAEIPEITSKKAFQAFVISLQDNPEKERITKKCLKLVYKLDEMPEDEESIAHNCNPDTYTFTYLTLLTKDETVDKKKDAKWWLDFWNKNKDRLVWNDELGHFEVSK